MKPHVRHEFPIPVNSKVEQPTSKLSIRSNLIELTHDLREIVERRIFFALSRFGPRIDRVSVLLEDVSGSRPSDVQRCRIVIKPQRGDELTVTATDADLHAAISFAADRAGRALQRELERRRTGSRQITRTPQTPAEPQDGAVTADGVCTQGEKHAGTDSEDRRGNSHS